MQFGRNSEAARRRDERRKREDEAPRLHSDVPTLATLDLEIRESKGATSADTAHTRRVVVASAPSLFEITCGDPSCNNGGYDLTHSILRELRQGKTSFEENDTCQGSVGSATCNRTLHCRAIATYRA